MGWRPIEYAEIHPPGGADATVWAWTLDKDGERRTVQVFVSRTAMSSSTVPPVVERARQTDGGSALAYFLEWREPPERIRFHTESYEPITEGGEPGPEVQE